MSYRVMSYRVHVSRISMSYRVMSISEWLVSGLYHALMPLSSAVSMLLGPWPKDASARTCGATNADAKSVL
jgi:hypothetical protein